MASGTIVFSCSPVLVQVTEVYDAYVAIDLQLNLNAMVDRLRGITYIFKQEGATTLGLAGRKLRVAIEALRRFDESGGDPQTPRRRELLGNAACLLSAYVIQREAVGLSNHKDLTAEFGLTPEIWNRVGAVS